LPPFMIYLLVSSLEILYLTANFVNWEGTASNLTPKLHFGEHPF
jgi:hypothetical protein